MADASGFRLCVHDDVPSDAARIVDTGVGGFNAAAAPLHDVRPLSCVARDAAGAIVGGAVGRSWGLCCELQQLWVAPSLRRRGIGTRIVRAFEARARARGCRIFYLETFSFQAPALYEALGYEAKLALHGFAPGIVKYTMVRDESPASPPATGC